MAMDEKDQPEPFSAVRFRNTLQDAMNGLVAVVATSDLKAFEREVWRPEDWAQAQANADMLRAVKVLAIRLEAMLLVEMGWRKEAR